MLRPVRQSVCPMSIARKQYISVPRLLGLQNTVKPHAAGPTQWLTKSQIVELLAYNSVK